MVVRLHNIKITVEVDTNKYTRKEEFEYDSQIDDTAMAVMKRASEYLEQCLDSLG